MKEFLVKPKTEIVMFTQRNNTITPHTACFPTSLAMALRNNGYPEIKAEMALDDEIMTHANSKDMRTLADKLGIPRGTLWLNQWWSIMERVANDYLKRAGLGLKAKWKANTSYEDIKMQIQKGFVPIIGTKLVHMKDGSWGGHIVTIVGYNTDMQYILCDPYGNPNTNYKDTDGFCITLDATLTSHITANAILFEKI